MPGRPDQLRAMVISAVMAAMALILPPAFHAAGLGSRFLPMFLPLLVNGFLVPFPWAVLTGVLTPLVSSLATGMPPLFPPVALTMALEGAVLGGVSAAIYQGRRSRLWWALLSAVALGRAATFASTWMLAQVFRMPPAFTSAAVILQGVPGVLLQLTVAPLVIDQLARRKGILFDHEPR